MVARTVRVGTDKIDTEFMKSFLYQGIAVAVADGQSWGFYVGERVQVILEAVPNTKYFAEVVLVQFLGYGKFCYAFMKEQRRVVCNKTIQ